MRRETMRSGLVGLLMLVWSVPAVAQTQLGTGALRGMVTDDSAAGVAGARVTIANVANGLTRETTSGPAGAFAVPVLPPGLYLATVTKAGFATWKADDVEVNVGGATTLAVTLRAASRNFRSARARSSPNSAASPAAASTPCCGPDPTRCTGTASGISAIRH